MPLPKPKTGESEQAYVSRVIPELVNAGHDQKQSAAIAYSTYRETKKDMTAKDAGAGVISADELRMGTREEMEEHNLTLEQGMKIAVDHLRRDPLYYSKLKAAGL